jgi:hypothetical protein
MSTFKALLNNWNDKAGFGIFELQNENDVVPCIPRFAWFKPVLGMHLEPFRDGGHSLSHPAASAIGKSSEPSNSWGRIWVTVRGSNSFEEIVHPHNLPEYLRRLEREREVLKKTTLDDTYRDSQYVGDLDCSL